MTNSWFTRAALPLALLAMLSFTAVNAQSGARGSGSVIVPAAPVAPVQSGSGTVLPQASGSATTSAPPTATYSAPAPPAPPIQGSSSVVTPGSGSVSAPPIVQGSGTTIAPPIVQGSGSTIAPPPIVQGSGSTVVPQGSGATVVSPGTTTFFQDSSFVPGTEVYQTYGCCSNSGFYQTAPRVAPSRIWRPLFRSSFRGSCQGY